MSETTKIAWCDSTVNDWEGCAKVSQGCANCYAEDRDKRWHGGQHWGIGKPRRKSKSATKQRASLNRKPWVCDGCGSSYIVEDICNQCGEMNIHRRRIFSLSLGDWLDLEVPVKWLAEMLESIRLAGECDHLLVTKRPEFFQDRMDSLIIDLEECSAAFETWVMQWRDGYAPDNIWVGVSVEDQKRADERIPELLKIPAKVRFLSVEPLLEHVNLGLAGIVPKDISPRYQPVSEMIDWVIVGGESGPTARPCNVEWIRSIVSQCEDVSVPVFVKQLGSNARMGGEDPSETKMSIDHPKGGDPSEWPSDLKVREFPIL